VKKGSESATRKEAKYHNQDKKENAWDLRSTRRWTKKRKKTIQSICVICLRNGEKVKRRWGKKNLNKNLKKGDILAVKFGQ